ncbi:MAG: RNA-protein complex protein Nop10 [Candidatus Bathyarchaeia archaeon]
MVWLLRRCSQCKRYTLRIDRCPNCGGSVVTPHPPPFSLDDKYRRYRRRMRELGG